ncbi:YbaN family protein [Massilicoli timonensis]|uniref:YbaN family protein n=1 Tax=Massilicoli timonensis TaxID=2015901 RepID=UPI0023F44FE7|nr:YbaN family protein [Massilicoli timonensis]
MKYIYLMVGCISFALGTAGAFLPLLPTVPFYLLAMFCFSKSSERLRQKLENSALYQKYVKAAVKGKGMSRRTKIKAMATVTLLMSIGFVMMHQVLLAQIVLVLIYVAHAYFILWRVRTIQE